MFDSCRDTILSHQAIPHHLHPQSPFSLVQSRIPPSVMMGIS